MTRAGIAGNHVVALCGRHTHRPGYGRRYCECGTRGKKTLSAASLVVHRMLFFTLEGGANTTSHSATGFTHMRSGMPCVMGNRRPLSGQISVPSTTCMSMRTRCNASKKEASSRSSGLSAGGREPSGMPTYHDLWRIKGLHSVRRVGGIVSGLNWYNSVEDAAQFFWVR